MSGYVVRVAQTIGGATAVHYLGRRIPSRTKAETSMRLAGIRGRWVDFVDARVFDDRAEAWIYVESLRVEDGLREWTDPISYVFDAHTIREVPTSGPCGYGWCSSLHAAEGQVHVTPDGFCSLDIEACEMAMRAVKAEREVDRLGKLLIEKRDHSGCQRELRRVKEARNTDLRRERDALHASIDGVVLARQKADTRNAEACAILGCASGDLLHAAQALKLKAERLDALATGAIAERHNLASRLETLLAVVSPLRHVNDSTPLVEASALVRNVVTVLHALDDRPGVVGGPTGIIGTVST